MSLLSDVLGTTQDVVGVKNLAEYFTLKNQLEINKGTAKTNNTINELNASADLLRLQNQARQTELAASKASNPFANIDAKKIGGYALLAIGAYAAFKLLTAK